jgi:hypothetical protein
VSAAEQLFSEKRGFFSRKTRFSSKERVLFLGSLKKKGRH